MHRPLKLVLAASVAALTLLGGAVVASPAVAAPKSVDNVCTDVEGIFAAGSGQDLGQPEFVRFSEQLRSRVEAGKLTYTSYEVGTESYGGQQYDPIPVEGNFFAYTDALDAKISSGGTFRYGNSVNRGVNELAAYMTERQEKCSSTLFVLGGYSQGAQVIGEAYTEKFSQTELSPIVYNILVGDPKLNLPEGRGFNPPACRGLNFSPWRAGQIGCNVDNGSLNARTPYLKADWDTRTGLWCNDHDFVCGSTKNLLDTDGHMTYAKAGGGIDAGVIEAMKRLKRTLGTTRGTDVDDSIQIIGTGTTGADVVFTIDSTGSMSYQIYAALAYAETMADSIVALRGRVALVEYRDADDAFVAEIRSPLSSDLTGFKAALAEIRADGGGDTPEALLSAIMTGLNGLDWKPGATKSNVILTDAGFHDPDVATGVTLAEVAKRALEIDPVNVYPVVPEYVAAEYEELAALTSGQVIVDTGDTAAALTEALVKISARPVPLLALTSYSGLTGEEFTFDASKSYVLDSEIVEYAFDFDGDGVFDSLGASPVVSHVYPAEFTGVMQVRATASDGGLATASATVSVTDEPVAAAGPAAPTGLTATVLSTVDGISEVDLSWTAADAQSAEWLLRVDGFAVGSGTLAETTLRVTDVERAADVTFSIAGVTADDLVGAEASVFLAAEPVQEPSPSPIATEPATSSTPGQTIALAALSSSEPIAPVSVADGGTTPIRQAASSLPRTGVDGVSVALVSGGILLFGGLGALLLGISYRRRNLRP